MELGEDANKAQQQSPPCKGDVQRASLVSFASSTSSSPRSTRCPPQHNHLPAHYRPQVLSDLVLSFTLDELTSYTERRKYGLSKYSVDWIDRAQKAIWDCTNGSISQKSIDKLRLFVLNKYRSGDSHTKVLSFAKAFLKFLNKARLDTRYYAFEVFLERPRAVKARNNVTNRLITKTDIENVLDTSLAPRKRAYSAIKDVNTTQRLCY
jgi:hypothetical protein